MTTRIPSSGDKAEQAALRLQRVAPFYPYASGGRVVIEWERRKMRITPEEADTWADIISTVRGYYTESTDDGPGAGTGAA